MAWGTYFICGILILYRPIFNYMFDGILILNFASLSAHNGASHGFETVRSNLN